MNSVNKSIVLGIVAGIMLIIVMVLGVVLTNQHYKELQEQPTAETVEVDHVEVQEQGTMITLNINGELHDYYYEFAE